MSRKGYEVDDMSVRVFCDLITASEVKEGLDDVILIGKMNSIDIIRGVTKVYVSSVKCAKRQHAYTKRGLGNVFLGFGGKDWTLEDFEYYYADNPKIFSRVNGSKHKYAVDIGNIFKDVATIEDAKAKANDFCLSLLTQETYNPRVLAKFGLNVS